MNPSHTLAAPAGFVECFCFVNHLPMAPRERMPEHPISFQRAGNLEPSSWAHYPFNIYAVPITCFTYGYPLSMTKQFFKAGSIRDQSAFP